MCDRTAGRRFLVAPRPTDARSMTRLASLRIGRLFGIPVELDPTWLLALLGVSSILAFAVYPEATPGVPLWLRVVAALGTTVLLYACLVAHEFSHSLVARRFGIPIHGITLFVFGGVARLGEEPRTPGSEFVLAVAGPAMSVALCAVFSGVFLLADAAAFPDWLLASIGYLALANGALVVFNLLPGYPMDGGRVLHSYLWWASGDRLGSTRMASWVGRLFGVVLAGAGLWLAVNGTLEGLWPILLGGFIVFLASSQYRMQMATLRLAAIPVGAVTRTPLSVVDAAASPEGIAAVAPGEPIVGVVSDGALMGLLVAPNASPASLPESAGAAPAPLDRRLFIDAGESLETAVRRFGRGASALVVVEDGRAIGSVTPDLIPRATR